MPTEEIPKPKWQFNTKMAYWKGKLTRVFTYDRIPVPCKTCNKNERRASSAYCQECADKYKFARMPIEVKTDNRIS